MTLQEIYELGIAMAMKADPRGEAGVKKLLDRLKKEYKELPEKKKKYFDEESLKNPYADSRIMYGDPKTSVMKIIAGIDAATGEIVLADRLNQEGANIDLVITHHPSGGALAGLAEVMSMQADYFADAGVPINVAEAVVSERQSLVSRRFKTIPNHGQTVDAAKLLDIPFMAMHTIWDNLGYAYMKNMVNKKSYETVGELFETIMDIPEFALAAKQKAAPMIVSGSEKNRPGKILVEFTGGTNAGKEMYAELAKAGIGTTIQMHISEDERKEMQKYHINAIDTGHIPSDSIGANIFLDALESKGVEVVTFGGLIRVKRSKVSRN